MKFNEKEVRDFYRLLRHEKETEIRILCPNKKNPPKSIFVQSEDEFVKECEKYNESYNIYAGINERKSKSTQGKDVISVKGFFLDIDAVRPKEFSKQPATDEELIKAKKIKDDIVKNLLAADLKQPIEIISGNGYQLFFTIPKVEIIDKNRKEFEDKLQLLQDKIIKRYDIDGAIDKIGDLPRIIKVTGTFNIKGNNTKERPHRLSKFLTNDKPQEDTDLLKLLNELELPSSEDIKEEKIIPTEKFDVNSLPKCINHLYNYYIFKEPFGWMRTVETLAAFFRGIGLPEKTNYKIMLDWANKQEYHEQGEDEDINEIVSRMYRNKIFVANCEKIRLNSGGFPEMGLKELFYYADVGECCGHYKNPVVYYNVKAKGEINTFNIYDYLTSRGINNKTGREEFKLNIDKFADYLIQKHDFKTWFGKNNDYCFHYNGKIMCQEARGIIKIQSQNLLENYCTRNISSEIFEKVKTKSEISKEEFEKDNPNLIPLGNGVWELDTKQLLPHSPDYNFRTFCPVNFDKEAKCKNWINFINETLYQEDILTMQEWFGFNLYREYFIKKGVICEGEQNTGKSVLLDTLIKFVGEQNKTGLSLQKITTGSDFTKLSLKDKWANIYDDLSSKDLSDGGAFKIATGGGWISGEEKFGEYQQFRSYAKQMFATNKVPPVKDNDDLAYFGRWIVFKFDNVPDKLDPFLRKKLWNDTELSGILNWALEGLYRLLENGRFSYNKSPEDIKLIMEASGSPLVAFSQEVLTKENDHIITKDDMFKVYSGWCEKQKRPRLTKEKLGRQLAKYCNYILADKHKERIWKNAKIKQEYQKYIDIPKKDDNTDASDTLKKNMREIYESSNNSNNYNNSNIKVVDIVSEASADLLEALKIISKEKQLIPLSDIIKLPFTNIDKCLLGLLKSGDLFTPKPDVYQLL